MRRIRKKCVWCAERFFPCVRLKSRQVSCGKPDCILRQRGAAKRRWRWKNRTLQRQMVRDWFAAHPDYLRTYRQRHPEYVAKNRLATRLRRLRARFDKRNRYFVTYRRIREKPSFDPP